MLILLSVTAYETRSAPKVHPPADEMYTTVFEKMLNLSRRTRFYRLKGFKLRAYMLQRYEDVAVSGGVCVLPLPLFWLSCFPPIGLLLDLKPSEKAKYCSQRESRLPTPTHYTYIPQARCSAGLPAPDESLPRHRPSSSGPAWMWHTGASVDKIKTGSQSCSFFSCFSLLNEIRTLLQASVVRLKLINVYNSF